MVDYMIEICRDKRLETIYALILRDNHRAIILVKEMGFAIAHFDEDTVKATLNLKEELKSTQKQVGPAQ